MVDVVTQTKRNILCYIRDNNNNNNNNNNNMYGYKLSKELSIPLSTVYEHLRTLREGGYIEKKKKNPKRQIIYSITKKGEYLILATE